MTDAIVRLIPGVLGDAGSALSDTFQDNLLAPPIYTRPADYKGWKSRIFCSVGMRLKLLSGAFSRLRSAHVAFVLICSEIEPFSLPLSGFFQ